MHVIKTSHTYTYTYLQCTKMAGEKQVYGGYDCEFVGAVSDRLNCNVCTKVLRDPHLAVCCGQHFCESCLNKWFTRQGKESCPHCRAEGGEFNHVIHKGLRSEVNQLKVRCSNHGEGCQWTGELGELKQHLESDSGCGFVVVECPNKCREFPFDVDIGAIDLALKISTMRRKDLDNHLTQSCYLRPYICKFCGLKDTYEAITGNNYTALHVRFGENDFFGHQATCLEVPISCPNKCGFKLKIKRKDMEGHRSQCPLEPVECPFAEVGCKVDVRRQQLEDHMTTSLQQHVMLLMIDRKQLKEELNAMKSKLNKAVTELDEAKLKLSKAEIGIDEAKCELLEAKAHLTTELGARFRYSVNKLEKLKDSVILIMPRFSEYRHSGKVWHSRPFYYRGGYKMYLAVHANGVGEGAGTHVSVAMFHLRGEYDDQLKWPERCGHMAHAVPCARINDGCFSFLAYNFLQYPAVSEHIQIGGNVKFCSLNNEKILHMVNDCLTFSVDFITNCYLEVKIKQ